MLGVVAVVVSLNVVIVVGLYFIALGSPASQRGEDE
jgi:hypothetical protein